VERGDIVVGHLVEDALGPVHCPGRRPPFSAVKRPARPYKSAIQNRFPMEDTKGA
jgi:hypothetical protein